MNDEVGALIVGYDNFFDVSLLDNETDKKLLQDNVKLVSNFCDYLDVNLQLPIQHSYIGVPTILKYVHKMDSLLNTITYNGKLNEIKNENIINYKQTVLNNTGKDTC